MAGQAHALKATRSAMMLRIQRAREKRGRLALALAERAHEAAASAERVARERRDMHELFALRRIGEAHGSLRGRAIDLAALDGLITLERSLQAASAENTRSLAAAEAAARDHDGALQTAIARLRVETKATWKRERLAETMARAWRQTVEAAEESERENQAADSWRRT